MGKMKSSVIIPTKDRKNELLKAIQSIDGQSLKPDELVIVDASTDKAFEREWLANFCSLNINYIHTEPGLTRQKNVGIRASSGEVVFFFDDDVVLEPNYISNILKVFENDERGEIGAVMGRLTEPLQGQKSKARRLIRKAICKLFLLTAVGDGGFRLSGFPTHPHHMNKPRYLECLCGGCTAFRRAVFSNLDFDENLAHYSYMEDCDIAKRLVDCGYKIYYEPSARLVHEHSSFSRLTTYQTYRMLVVNHYYLFQKNWRQTPLRKVAFWWSIVGLVFAELYSPLGKRMKGVMAGILDILTARDDLVRKGRNMRYEELRLHSKSAGK